MQGLTDAPRENTLASDTTDLIFKDADVEITWGCRHLDTNLTLIDELQPYMTAGSVVSRSMSAAIHGSCVLNLSNDAPVNYLTDFFQPHITLSSMGKSATFYLGVYTLESPTYDNSVRPALLPYTGYDLLYYLNQPIADSFQALKNSDPISGVITAIGLAFPGASILSSDSGKPLPTDMVWAFDSSNNSTTYLMIINELLDAAGYQHIWVDWNGQFIVQPYVRPSARSIETTLDVQTLTNIVASPRTSSQDLFTVPNFWRFIMNNLTVSPVEGTTQFTYTDSSPINPGSTVNRGRVLNRQTQYLTATDYGSLYQQGIAQVVAALSPAETFSLSTFPIPLLWHEDQITYADDNIADIAPTKSRTRHTQSLNWSITLDANSDTTLTLQTVTE